MKMLNLTKHLKKKQYIAVSVLVLLIFILLFSYMGHCRSRLRDLPNVLKTGRLLVLTDSSSVGFSKHGDSISGFQYELVKAFADHLGVELVVTEQNDLNECLQALQIGDYDLIASYMPVTTEHQDQLLFSDPLFISRQILVQRVNTDTINKQKIHTNQLDLANDTIYLPANSPNKIRLINLSEEIAAPITLIEMNNKSTEQMVDLVASGKIKQTICDEQLASVLKQRYPIIDINLTLGFEQQQAWAVHAKCPLLLSKLNEFLNDYKSTSEYWEIYRKYFDVKQDVPLVDTVIQSDKINKKTKKAKAAKDTKLVLKKTTKSEPKINASKSKK